MASKKLGGAVARNRAKRLIRELFRTIAPAPWGSPAVDLVVIPRRELLSADFIQITKDFRHTWRRGLERISANSRG